MNNYSQLFNMDSGNIDEISQHIPDKQELSILDKLNNRIDPQENKIDKIKNKLDYIMDLALKKMDRNTTEIMAICSVVATIKAKVCGEICKPKKAMPSEQLKTIDDLDRFEQSLQEERAFKNLISELMMSGEKPFEKWIQSSWRSIVDDKVTRQCSWRGTDTKKCIRGLRVTLAIRAGFKERFALEDADFERMTQKFFQYAQDRVKKSQKKK